MRYNARGAVIPTELVPPGAAMLLSLRFAHCRSLPLELTAQPERQLDDGRTFVAITTLNDAQGDAIERLVFAITDEKWQKHASCADKYAGVFIFRPDPDQVRT